MYEKALSIYKLIKYDAYSDLFRGDLTWAISICSSFIWKKSYLKNEIM